MICLLKNKRTIGVPSHCEPSCSIRWPSHEQTTLEIQDPIVSVEIEAVFSMATQVIAWRDLQDDSVWRQV
jgi:hypothetical protein